MQNKKPKCYVPHEYMSDSNYTKSSFYKNMFIEDIIHTIIPVSLKRNNDDCNAILDCNEKDLDLMKNILNSLNRTYREEYDISRLILTAIEEIVRNIAWHGEAIYEICKVSDNDIKMIGLLPEKFIDFKFFYIQIPPKNNNKTFPKIIPDKLLWKISVPKILQKNYSFKTILSRIDQFDSHMPKSMKDDLYNGKNISTYDYKKYDEKNFLYVNELTKDWGWDQRKWTANDKTTDFYNLYKQLKFRYSLSIFREHIIFELNNLFLSLNIDATIKLENAVTSNKYKDKLEKYLKGQITYDEIIKFLY